MITSSSLDDAALALLFTAARSHNGWTAEPVPDALPILKASYKVFPSAYASGAIAKCRKNKGK
jgi:hypothetical protein